MRVHFAVIDKVIGYIEFKKSSVVFVRSGEMYLKVGRS